MLLHASFLEGTPKFSKSYLPTLSRSVLRNKGHTLVLVLVQNVVLTGSTVAPHLHRILERKNGFGPTTHNAARKAQTHLKNAQTWILHALTKKSKHKPGRSDGGHGVLDNQAPAPLVAEDWVHSHGPPNAAAYNMSHVYSSAHGKTNGLQKARTQRGNRRFSPS